MSLQSRDPTAQILAVLETYLSNPVSRRLLRSLSRRNGDYGRSTVDYALEWYSGTGHPHSVKAVLEALPVILLLEVGRRNFGVSHEAMAEYFGDPVARRGLSNILRSIGEFGVTRPQRLVSPFLVVWNFTNACNLKCRHCYQDASRALSGELSIEEKLDVVDQLADADVVAIAFSGGEPLVHPHVWKVAEYASKRGVFVSVATNGTLLTDENVSRLKDVGVGYVEISLDASTPERHDSFRGVDGAWQRTVDGIVRASRAGLSTCVATTVTRDNYDDISAVIAKARQLGARRFIAFNFIPAGRGREITSRDITPEMREKMLEHLFSYAGSGFEVFSTAPQFGRVCTELSAGAVFSPTHFGVVEAAPGIRVLADFIGGCGAGRMYCAVQPDGIVTPCVFMPIPLGSVRERRFMDIWTGSQVVDLLQRRDHLKGSCGTCHYKTVCGGCRARAYAYFGDISAPDPGCIRYQRMVEVLAEGKAGTSKAAA